MQLDPARCLAWKRMACRGCVDSCGDAAIRTSAGLEPVIDPAQCSGCALCVAVCPVDAIYIPLLGDTCD